VRPALLVFHEPTSAVDPQMVGEALSIMEDLQREDTSMLIGTRNALCA
jgi:ABC-type histidine transport system ATPase subunit